MPLPLPGTNHLTNGKVSYFKRHNLRFDVQIVHEIIFCCIIYWKGLNYIAGMLLLITKDEKRSFWLLAEILDRLVPGMDRYSVSNLLKLCFLSF